jgi:hypothetical protein
MASCLGVLFPARLRSHLSEEFRLYHWDLATPSDRVRSACRRSTLEVRPALS